VSDAYEPTEYPPANWEAGSAFEAPGPMSRPLANYLAMCAPRARHQHKALLFRDHDPRLAFVGALSVN
jgi:hypothetical protein